MPGTILKNDLQSSIEDQLSEYARQLQQASRGAQQTVGDTWEDLQRAGRTGVQDVQNQLSEYATQAYNATQQAAYEAQQEKARQAAAVQQHLSEYANQLTQQPTAGQSPSLPHSEEPGTATDQVTAGGNVGSKWKTQFDFGATYTGDYRTGTPHRGVDLVPTAGSGIGTEVDAFTPGTVTLIQRDNGAGGLMVYVEDADHLTHAYMHLAGTAPGLRVGDPVQRGQPIAQMGESGTEGSPHLHYEVRKNAASGDPLDQLIDPRPYLAGTKQPGVGGVPGAVQDGVQTVQGAANRIGQGKDDFIASLAPIAKQFADQTGIDPALMLAIAGHETGWGQSQNAREKNNLFSIQGASPQGGRWAGYNSPQESFQAFVDLISQAPRYAQAWADRHNPGQFIEDLRQAHYVVDEPGFPAQTWVDATKRIYGDIAGQVAAAPAAARRAFDQTPGGAAASNQSPFAVTNLGGEAPAAKPPIYMSTMQGGEDQNPLQSKLQDIQEQLDSLRRTLEPYNQPPLAGAPEAAARAVGGAAEAVGGAFNELGRQVGPNLGFDDAELKRRRAALTPTTAAGAPAFRPLPPEQYGPGEIAGAVGGALFGQPFGQVQSQAQKQAAVTELQRGFAETSPTTTIGPDIRLPGQAPEEQPIHVGGMLIQGLVDQVIQNPLLFIPGAPMGEALNTFGGALVQDFLPQLGPLAGKLTASAINGGVQNALFEAGQPNATPRSIGEQFLVGLGFGSALGGLGEVATTLGRRFLARVPDLQQLLRTRQRGEVDLGLLTTGEPTPREAVIPPRPPDRPVEPLMIGGTTRAPSPPPATRVAGVQRLPTYVPAGAPEAGFEALARASREAEPDGRARIDLNTVPKDILPFTTDPVEAQQEGMVKLNPGGMPHLDDLRALWEANQHKRSFYTDQGDEAANIVGAHNTGEFFTLNSINSILTRVNSQVAESIQAAGLVRKVAREGRAAGLDDATIKQNILDAIADPKQNPLTGKSVNTKRNSQLQGYSTGDAAVSSGAKTSSFAGNYTSAEGRFFDPRITNDLHNWRLMNVSADEIPSLRKNQRTGEMEWFIDRPHEQNVANNDRAYRGVESVIGELARESGVDGYSLQSGLWDGMRSLQRDPEALRLWQQGHFRDAIELGKRRNLFGQVSPDMEFSGDVRSVMDSMPVRRALEQYGEYLKDPLPRELGISGVERTFRGKRLGRSSKTSPAAKPSNIAFREQERPFAEQSAPLVQGLDRPTADRLGYDPERGTFPWLEASHRVVEVAPDEYAVHLPAGNEDTARYVAAQVGQASNAERVQIHVPDYRSGDVVGVGARGTPDQIGALQRALDNMGITNIVGTGRRSLQVPLERVGDTRTLSAVQDAAISIGFPEEQVGTYNGRHSDVPRTDYAATSERLAPTFAPTSAVRSDLLQRGLGAVPAERGPPRGRQRGEANIPFAANLGGAVLGGYAGSAATPEDASLDERLRNIGIGATAGLLGTRAMTGGRLGRALEARAGAREGFQAPRRPEGPELRATTQEPPGGPPGRPPRTLGEVRSNPYALREAAAGEQPMTIDEMDSYAQELEQRLTDVQNRRDAVDEMLRNPTQKVERPPWAAGYTNIQLAEIARRHDISPYQEAWWDTVGLESGSGEVRENVGESGLRGAPSQRELSPTELRAERARLDQEAGNITAAYEQMSSAPAEPNLVRVAAAREARGAAELPFDTGAPPDEGPVPVTEAQGSMEEGARRVQEVILSKNRGTLRSTEGDVTLEKDGVRTTALVSHQAIQDATAVPPSARTLANMPNLDALLKDEPEIAAQIRKAVEDHQDAFELYRQGVVSMDSLRNDLAKRVGMSVEDWNKTKIGQAFNPEEMMALQAAAVEQTGRMMDTARTIVDQGGVDSLSPEELVFSAAQMASTVDILRVARGGRTTAGRTLNALKQRFDRTMAQGITQANEQLAARRLAQQARRAATRATTVLAKGRELEREATTAKASASRSEAPRNIIDQIAAAYDELDRYNAMTLHEKGVEFDRLKAERAKRAEARKAVVRGAPQELLSALKAELAAEQKIFAGRKNTWEEMAFWDSKAAEKAVEKRTAFRGQLYIEQQRKLANIAAKDAEKNAAREFNAKLEESQKQQAKAERLLQDIGGREVTANLLKQFIAAANDPSPDAAAKFLKGMAKQNNWARANIIRVAGLVSGPLTNMVNIGGNAGNAMLEVPTRALVVGIDAFRSAITGGERQAYKAELLPMLQAYGPGMYGSLPNAVRALKTGINPLEAADLSKVRAGFGSGNTVVDAAAEMPLRLLTAEDIVFRSAAVSAHSQRVAMREATREGFRGNAAKGRAANIVANLEEYPELAREVYDAAARMVFQERRALPLPGQLPQGTKAVQEAGRLAVSQVAPFIRTPTNITAQGIAMSPIGFGGALEAARGVRELPTGTRVERYARGRQVLLAEERAARAVIGTVVLGTGVTLGLAGLMTAAYPEDEQARSALPQGWRPWSLKVTNPVDKNTYYVPLQNFGAAGVPLAMAAIATDPVHRGRTLLSPEEWGQAVTGIGKYVLDNTFLQGLSDFVDALQDPTARGGKFGESLVASYGPYSGLFRESQRAFGVAARNPHAGLIGLVEAMEANYPGLSGNVPPSRLPLGDERVQGATGASRLLPLRFDIEKDEPTLRILRNTGVGIPKPPKAIGIAGGSVPLTEDEQAQLQQMRGQAIRSAVASVREDPIQVQRAVDLATASATKQFINQLGSAAVNQRWERKAPNEPYYLGTAAD